MSSLHRDRANSKGNCCSVGISRRPLDLRRIAGLNQLDIETPQLALRVLVSKRQIVADKTNAYNATLGNTIKM